MWSKSSVGCFRTVGFFLVASGLFAILPIWGCGSHVKGSSSSGPGWIDLVASGAAERTTVLHHDDQTFVGIELSPKKPSASFSVRFDHPVSLTLSGGYSRTGDRPPVRRAFLRYWIGPKEAPATNDTVEIQPDSVWWHVEVPLDNDLAGEASVTIETDLENGHLILLREARVQQKIPRRKLSAEKSQILLISIDTLREDALGIFEGPWATPNLDGLALEEAQRWSPHYSGAGWTKPSHAAMLTGYRGDTHQMSDKERVMAPDLPTLAGRLSAGGFKTAAIVYDCKWLDPKWGFDRGFDSYSVVDWNTDRTAYQVSNWIDAHRDESFFFFFHTFQPHSDWYRLPYESAGTTAKTVAERFGVNGYGCEEGRCASKRLTAINAGKAQPLPNETDILRYLYGRGVEDTDRALGILFDDLRRKGLWDNLLVIVTSDHGEAFYEHGRYLHGLMWNEIVRVPLIVKWPDGRHGGESRNVPSSSVDLAPTILEFAGLEVDDLPGTPLQQLTVERPIFIGGPSRMLVDGDWKIILGGNGKDVKFLSSLSRDPGEHHDLSATRADATPGLLKIVRAFIRNDMALRNKYQSERTPSAAPLNEEEKEKLRALGYLE